MEDVVVEVEVGVGLLEFILEGVGSMVGDTKESGVGS